MANSDMPSAIDRIPHADREADDGRARNRTASGRWTVAVGGGPALDLGLDPVATGSVRIFVSVRRGAVSAEVGAEASWPSQIQQADGSGFREYGVGGDLGLCGHVDPVALCALGTLGSLRVQGVGVDHPAAPDALVSRAGVGVRVSQPLGERWSAVLRADGLVLLTPWQVALNGESVWTMPTIGSVLGVDLVGRWP
jgi:hypothetical protein